MTIRQELLNSLELCPIFIEIRGTGLDPAIKLDSVGATDKQHPDPTARWPRSTSYERNLSDDSQSPSHLAFPKKRP